MAGWTDLPWDILVVIAQHLAVIEDFASFGALCKECHFVTTMLKKKTSLPPRYPRLMLPENRGFVNLLTSETIEVELPEATDRFCLGAHYGWLFTLNSDLQMNLLHPFSRQQISLPPMPTMPVQFDYDNEFAPEVVIDMRVIKSAMSTSPLKGNNLNDECVIVAIFKGSPMLAFARLGDSVWTDIQVPFPSYKDVVYYKGKFYAVGHSGVVVVCDTDDKNGPKAMVVASAPSTSGWETRKYLVESSGDLLLVFRDPEVCYVDEDDQVKRPHYYTVAFTIWRLDECREGNDKWMKVTTLGDRALFLGRNVSASKASSDGIKANCIYFTDDYNDIYCEDEDGGGWDTGIFRLEDGSIEFEYRRESLSKLSPSLWYI